MAITSPESGFNANTASGVGLHGVIFIGFTIATGAYTRKLGITRGGVGFNPNGEWRNVPYDGQHAPTTALDRRIMSTPEISGTMLEVTNQNLLEILEPGGATPSTLKDSGTFLSAGNYLTNVAVAFKRSDGSFFGYNLPVALVTQYDVQGAGSDGEVEVAITIQGRRTPGATPDELTPPYEQFEVAA